MGLQRHDAWETCGDSACYLWGKAVRRDLPVEVFLFLQQGRGCLLRYVQGKGQHPVCMVFHVGTRRARFRRVGGTDHSVVYGFSNLLNST